MLKIRGHWQRNLARNNASSPNLWLDPGQDCRYTKRLQINLLSDGAVNRQQNNRADDSNHNTADIKTRNVAKTD